MSDNLTSSEQQRNVRQKTGEERPVLPTKVTFLRSASPGAPASAASSSAAPSTPSQAPATASSSAAPSTPSQAPATAAFVSPGATQEAPPVGAVEENLPAWKANLKDAITVNTDTNDKVSVWAQRMFMGVGAAMKGVLEHIKSISFTKDGKTAYKTGEGEEDYVLNLEKGWKKILGDLADDYAYSVYIKDRRIYFLKERHTEEFGQVRTGVIPKGKDGARKVFARLQKEDLELVKEKFNELPKQGRKITNLQRQTAAIATLRGKLNWTRLTSEEVKALQAWFKTGEVAGRKGVGDETNKPKKLSYKAAVASIAATVNELYNVDEEHEITEEDLRDAEQTRLREVLTAPVSEGNDDGDDEDGDEDDDGEDES